MTIKGVASNGAVFYLATLTYLSYVSCRSCNLTIAVYLPLDSDLYLDVRILGPGTEIALEKLSKTTLQGFHINWIRLKTPCQSKNATSGACEHPKPPACDIMEGETAYSVFNIYKDNLFSSHPLAAVVGTGCSKATQQLADLASAAALNFMVLEGSGVSAELDNKDRYSTLVRFSYTQKRASQLVLQFMQTYNWTNAVVVYNTDEPIFRVLNSIADSMKLGCPKCTIEKMPYNGASNCSGTSDLRLVMAAAHNKTRVAIIISTPDDLRCMMIAAYAAGYTTGDHVYIGLAYFKTQNYFGMPQWSQADDSSYNNEAARQAFRSLFLLRLTVPVTEEFFHFRQRVEAMSLASYVRPIPPTEEVNTHAIGYHDSIIAYAEVLNQTFQETGNCSDLFDGAAVARRMINHTFHGVRGTMRLDGNNDLKGNFEILSFRTSTSNFTKVIDFPENATRITNVHNVLIEWVNGSAPPNVPPCGYTGNSEACLPKQYMVVYITVGTAVGIALMLAVWFFCLYGLHRAAELRDGRWWEVSQEEITRIRITRSRANMVGSMTSTLDTPSEVGTENGQFGGSAVNTAELRGQIVFVLPILPFVHLSQKTTTELAKLRQTSKCEKLVCVIGICSNIGYPAILYEYCPRGDVNDLVQNSESYPFITDWNLRLSLMKDIVEGLFYIHHSWIHHHGKLRSSKCVMDQCFVVKITDYALRDLRGPARPESIHQKQLWAAPEIINFMDGPNPNLPETMHRADIYSLGMIMMECVWLNDPSKPDRHWTTDQVTARILRGPDLGSFTTNYVRTPSEPPIIGPLLVPARPADISVPANGLQLPKTDKSRRLVGLITSCLTIDPARRPDIATVQKRLITIAGGEAGAVMDNLIRRMAKYAEDLETIVAVRTYGIQEEQRKIETLLFEILPRSVATSLISGNTVYPEAFDFVTVLFCSVEEFGELVASVHLLDVIMILNELYSMIDKAITDFDCYKVETIADVYMVASGLPIRNRNRHVSQIAFFATHLIKIAATFSVRPLPTHKFLLRIGFHTGACMAGVIGQKMPRYCLFGDTINTASRMQSTSEGGKVQISNISKEFLELQREWSSFKVSPRGLVMVKGKGEMQTYWLKPATTE